MTVPYVPSEIISEIGAHMGLIELNNLRLGSKRFQGAVEIHFGKCILLHHRIFPTQASLLSFLAVVDHYPAQSALVDTVTLVSEGPKLPELGYEFEWGAVERRECVEYTQEDLPVQSYINEEHEKFCAENDKFIVSGEFRCMLSNLFSRLPKLKTIKVRRMRPGEHIPQFRATEALKDLSYYRPNLPTRNIFYGDYQYDTLHARVTVSSDEFGEKFLPPDAGPQATCIDDIIAAMESAGCTAIIEHIA